MANPTVVSQDNLQIKQSWLNPVAIPALLAVFQVAAFGLSLSRLDHLLMYGEDWSMISAARDFFTTLTLLKAVAGEFSSARRRRAESPTHMMATSALLFICIFLKDLVVLILAAALLLLSPLTQLEAWPLDPQTARRVKKAMIGLAFSDLQMDFFSRDLAAVAAGLSIGVLLFLAYPMLTETLNQEMSPPQHSAAVMLRCSSTTSICSAFLSLSQIGVIWTGNPGSEEKKTVGWVAVLDMLYALCMLLGLKLAVLQQVLSEWVLKEGLHLEAVMAAAAVGFLTALANLIFISGAILFSHLARYL